MTFRRMLQEGFIAGLIGAGAVAAWFLIVDIAAGTPFFTPAMLGDALFWGVRDPAHVRIAFDTVIGYTTVHALAFVVAGIVASIVACEVELFPSTLYVAAAAFAVFEFGFYILLGTLARPMLGALTWWNVAIGNAIAAAGMGYYLWRRHPSLRSALRDHPLGEPMDQGVDEPATRNRI